MEVCCSFKSIVGGSCGFDRKDRKQETQVIPLLACAKNISSHTTSYGFSGIEDEVDLILSRAAVFRQPVNISSMTICPLHRSKLGLGWSRGSNTRCRVWRSVTDKIFKLQNEQYETHTYKTKIGHKMSKQQKMNRTTQK